MFKKGGIIMAPRAEIIRSLKYSVLDQSKTQSFWDFQDELWKDSRRCLRSVFQLFSDMITTYMEKTEDAHLGDPERLGYDPYDSSKLFREEVDEPFFSDLLFDNKLVQKAQVFKSG